MLLELPRWQEVPVVLPVQQVVVVPFPMHSLLPVRLEPILLGEPSLPVYPVAMEPISHRLDSHAVCPVLLVVAVLIQLLRLSPALPDTIHRWMRVAAVSVRWEPLPRAMEGLRAAPPVRPDITVLPN